MKDDTAQKRQKWQERLSKAKSSYQAELDKMDGRLEYYNGTHKVRNADGSASKKEALNVRNIVYELIESQVDSTVPQPRVTALHEEDKELAKKLEALLANEARRLHFKEMNDLQERTVPIQGGDFWHVEWDPQGGFHCTLGALTVTERNPRQVIPQPGIYDVEKMDYLFVLISQSKQAIKRRYGVEVQDDTETDPEARSNHDQTVEDLVTQKIAYYRNDQGGIGMFSWVGDQTLEDMENYQARRAMVCKRCGEHKTSEECPRCGSKSFVEIEIDEEEIAQDITISDGEVLPATTPGKDVPIMGPGNIPMLDDFTGEVIMGPGKPVRTKIPYYKPNAFPVILRRNVRAFGQLLGNSDVDVIADQQDAINKYGTKIQEKLLKGGSYVTLPQGVGVETTDRELKVIRLKNPADKALISVLNIQPDTSRDQQMLETNYSWAKSTLGVTDAFQGKYDASATSGTAKQFSANQSAGRLQSKREMKNQAYANLYKLMFQFLLAYTEEPWPITYKGPDGQQEFEHFDRYAFLKRDVAGELYWNDEFLFEVDPASNLSSNRETLWNMVDVKYQAGAFGPPQELESQYRLWTLLAEDNFPHAEAVRNSIHAEIEEKRELEAQMQQMQQMQAMQQMQGMAMEGEVLQ